MRREIEIALLKELIALRDKKEAFLDDTIAHSSVERYTDIERFELERTMLFTQFVQPVAHSSELPSANSFLRREFAGLPLLFTRDKAGTAHVFLNVCRHRGTRLVDEHQGCQQRFSCPYHAWTWNNSGELIGIPGQAQGFPSLNRNEMSLKRLGSAEHHGWIWVNPNGQSLPDSDHELGTLTEDFHWIFSEKHTLLHQYERICNANWKILVEGGLEAYHFRVAHSNTIGPYFYDNLSTYQTHGHHIRSILPKRSMDTLSTVPENKWKIRDHAQILYTLFPTSILLVQSDHVSWIYFEPISVDTTIARISTLVPDTRAELADDLTHWERNHKITVDTLNEDFDLAESIQSGLLSGANQYLTFGRFEGALAQYNRIVEQLLS